MADPRKRSFALLGGYLLAAITLTAAISESVSLVPRLYSLYEQVRPWMISLTDRGHQVPQAEAPPGERAPPPATEVAEPAQGEPPPLLSLPKEQRVAAMPYLPSLMKYEILIDFPAHAAASQTGVEIARVDRQSRFKGWLCPQDRIVSIDGAPLAGNNSAELREDLVKRLQASPDFLIRFRPMLDPKHVTWDDARELGMLDGRTVHQAAGPRRDC